MSVIASLKAKAESEVAKAATEWEILILKVAADEATEGEVNKVLKLSGKSLSDLEAAVERLREIRRLESDVALYPERVSEQRRTQAEHATARQELQTVSKKLEAELKRTRYAAFTACHLVEQSREAGIQLGRLLGHEISLPPIATTPEAVAVVAPVAEVQHITSPIFDIQLPSDSVPA